jgi:hypothetical protein
LADINDTKVVKRRSRRKIAISDGLLKPEEIPVGATKKRTRTSPRKQPSTDNEAQDDSNSLSATVPTKPRRRISDSGKSSLKEVPGTQILKNLRTRKIPLSLLQNPWDDVTRYLKSAYSSRKNLGDSRRAHVISESLCGMYKSTEIDTSTTD